MVPATTPSRDSPTARTQSRPSKSGFTFSPANKAVTLNGANSTGVNFTASAVTWSISGTIASGSGATVTLSGAASASTTADGSGNYTFSGLANGSYTVTPSKSGLTFSPSSKAVTVSGGSVSGVSFAGSSVPTSPPTMSMTPTSGTGSSKVFAFHFSESSGADHIVAAQIDINASLGVIGACYIYYASNKIFLATDAGATQSPVTIGTPGTVQNSQCMVDAGASSVSLSGNNLTLNLALSFTPAFAGSKIVYLEAYNGVFDSSWSQYGTWIVPAASNPPDFSLGVSPGNQNITAGGGATYTVTTTALNGFSGTVILGVNGLPSGANATFNPPSLAGSGSSSMTVNTTSGVTPGTYPLTVTGTSGVLSHTALASINVTGINAGPPSPVSVTPASGSGATRTFAFTFYNPGGASGIVAAQIDINASLGAIGACYLYYASNKIFLATDAGATQSPAIVGSPGTVQNSQCTVDAGASSVSMSGNNLTLNLAMSFTPAFAGAKIVYLEAYNGVQDSGWSQLGTWTVPANSNPPDFSLSVSPGNQSIAAGGGTTYTVTTTGLNGFGGSVNLSVNGLPAGATGTFNPPSLTGSGSSTLTVNTSGGVSPGTFPLTVTGTSGSLSHGASASLNITGGSAGPPSAVSVTPGSGSGSTQTFAFTFSNPAGAAGIVSAQIDINASLGVVGACYIYYASNKIFLATDAGATQSPAIIGSPGTVQNNQCLVDAGASSVSMSGNNLTLHLAMSFTPAFAGAKVIYLDAYNGVQDSGWSQIGTWTVPSTPNPPDFSLKVSPGTQSVTAGGGADLIR